MKVDFYKHSLDDSHLNAVGEVLKSAFLTAGPKTAEFEKRFAEWCAVDYSIGLTSCTAGLFLAIRALDLNPGDEVIVPAMTFIATSNVVLQCGGTPVFVDVESDTGLIDVKAVEAAITKRTRAVIPVHLYGHMADMQALRKLADKHKLFLLEDAAHSVEAVRDGHRPGQLGDAVAYSFYATKNLTCGEGGALNTRHQHVHDRVRILRQHGMSKSAAERYHNKYQHYDMLDLGFKYNMFDIQAALLLPQLENIEAQWQRREQICSYYEREFRTAGIAFPIVVPGAKSGRHLFTIWAPRGKRDAWLQALQDKQIGVAVNYRAVHLMQYYREHFGFTEGILPVAEMIGDRTITLPLYPRLTDAEVEYVVKSVIEISKT
jgi:dTDP-4-amino-4,6-dideoxygalactose transaminase